MTTTSEEDMRSRCKTCKHTEQWHKDNKPIHPFNDGSAGATAFLGAGRNRDTRRGAKTPQNDAEDAPRVVWPTDPVLRVALINAKVLTPEDLRAAEDQLRSALGLGQDKEE